MVCVYFPHKKGIIPVVWWISLFNFDQLRTWNDVFRMLILLRDHRRNANIVFSLCYILYHPMFISKTYLFLQQM